MDKLNGDGAFADAGGDALDRPAAHVTGDKNTGQTGFEKPRTALELPALRRLAVADKVGAAQNEPLRIALDGAIEPFRARLGADEDKQGRSRQSADFAARGAAHRDGLQPRFAVCFGEAGNELD